MKKQIMIISLVIIILVTLISCKSSSITIGEHNNLLSADLKGMDISPVNNPSNTKMFIQSESEEILEYFLKIQPEEIIIPEENTKKFENPYYYILLHFENSDYNLVVGENYIVVIRNDMITSLDESIKDEIIDNTNVYLITDETRIEFYEMIKKVIDSTE